MTPQEVFQLPVRPSLQRITQSIAQLQATRVLELGTSVGVSTRLISQALQVTKGHLWSIDINPPIDNWHLAWDCSNIAFLQHDALTYPWKQEVDLLFIDDKHSYRHLLQELRKYAPWVRAGGVIYVDDTTKADDTFSHEQFCGLAVTWAIQMYCRELQLPWHSYHEDAQGLAEIPVPSQIAPLLPLDKRWHNITGVAAIVNSVTYHRDDV